MIITSYVSMNSDFFMGALTAAGVMAAYQIYHLFQYPSLASLEERARKPVQQVGDDNEAEIVLFGFDRKGECPQWDKGILDTSTYVSRVEAYLRLIGKGKDYAKRATDDISENPRGKVPFANTKGTMIDDSSRIIEYLQNTYDIALDKDLTEDQTTTGHLIRCMLFGTPYWVIVHSFFCTERGRKNCADYFGPKVPSVLLPMVLAQAYRGFALRLKETGVGLLSRAEICQRGARDIQILSKLLGKHDFIMGTKNPTSYDSDVYSTLAFIFYGPATVENGWVVELKQECPNLVFYLERMKKILMPELYDRKHVSTF